MATDDGPKITIRISNTDIQLMEDYMSEHEIENRSDFVRDAIRGFIASTKNSAEAGEDGIYVHLSGVQMQALENMKKDGTIFDGESYIRQLVLSDMIPKDSMDDSKARAFKAAQQLSRIM